MLIKDLFTISEIKEDLKELKEKIGKSNRKFSNLLEVYYFSHFSVKPCLIQRIEELEDKIELLEKYLKISIKTKEAEKKYEKDIKGNSSRSW